MTVFFLLIIQLVKKEIIDYKVFYSVVLLFGTLLMFNMFPSHLFVCKLVGRSIGLIRFQFTFLEGIHKGKSLG